jgi:predicted XRE-type DNA-binding protein
MMSPESFQSVVAPELPPPTREQLRSSLIEEPFRSVQRAIEDAHEQAAAEFEEKLMTVVAGSEETADFYRRQIDESFGLLHAQIGAECELRLKDFDKKADTISTDQLEVWFSNVTRKAAEERERYLGEAQKIRDSAMMALMQFKTRDV